MALVLGADRVRLLDELRVAAVTAERAAGERRDQGGKGYCLTARRYAHPMRHAPRFLTAGRSASTSRSRSSAVDASSIASARSGLRIA